MKTFAIAIIALLFTGMTAIQVQAWCGGPGGYGGYGYRGASYQSQQTYDENTARRRAPARAAASRRDATNVTWGCPIAGGQGYAVNGQYPRMGPRW